MSGDEKYSVNIQEQYSIVYNKITRIRSRQMRFDSKHTDNTRSNRILQLHQHRPVLRPFYQVCKVICDKSPDRESRKAND